MASHRFAEQTRLARASSAVAISDGRPSLARTEPANDSTKVKTVRTVGLAGSARGLVPHGHLCWAYQDGSEFRARALEYMADGIALGQ